MALKRKAVFRGIGQRLTVFRQHQKLTKLELASRLGLHHSGYYKNENDETLPGFLTFYKLKEQFGLSTDWLLYGVEPMYIGQKTAADKQVQASLSKELEHTKQELVETKNQLQRYSGLEHAAPEIEEMFRLMRQDPQFKYEILGHFHKYKKENSRDK